MACGGGGSDGGGSGHDDDNYAPWRWWFCIFAREEQHAQPGGTFITRYSTLFRKPQDEDWIQTTEEVEEEGAEQQQQQQHPEWKTHAHHPTPFGT